MEMEDERKTKKQLIQELHELRQSVAEAENLKEEIKHTRVNQEKFTKAFLQNSIPTIITSVKDSSVVEVSDAFLRLVGLKRHEIIGNTAVKGGFITKEQREIFFNELNKNGHIENLEMEVRLGNGELRHGLFNSVMISINNENCALTTIQDITERKQAEEALQESEERFRGLFSHMSSGVAVYEAVDNGGDFIFRDFNSAAEKIEKVSRKDIIGKRVSEAFPGVKAFGIFEVFQRVWQTGKLEYFPQKIYRDERDPGSWRESWVFKLPAGEIVALYNDITERKQVETALQKSEQRYQELSIIDDLTTLYNSRHFYAQLKIELERSTRYEQLLTLVLLDLDDFKKFNDTYGHIEGDKVLRRLGHVIKRCLRETDSAYRYGGEEFTILLPMTTSVDGAVTAERIRTEFKKEIFSPALGQEVSLTISIGLAQYKPKEDIKAFVHRVDQLMYQGKKKGKDRVCSEVEF